MPRKATNHMTKHKAFALVLSAVLSVLAVALPVVAVAQDEAQTCITVLWVDDLEALDCQDECVYGCTTAEVVNTNSNEVGRICNCYVDVLAPKICCKIAYVEAYGYFDLVGDCSSTELECEANTACRILELYDSEEQLVAFSAICL